ncbi:MAG TPA: hypothetical protein V6C46_05850 [Coleofasciculaceae cyanobacterium]
MPLNRQTSPFPAIAQPDRGWDKNITAALDVMFPLATSRNFRVNIPTTAGAPVAGLTPIFNNGYIVKGDNVLQLTPDVAPTATASTTTNLYYGLAGPYYAAAVAKASDVQLASVATATDGFAYTAQLVGYGSYRYAIRAQLFIANLTDGSDVPLYTFIPPLGFSEVRVVYAMARVMSAASSAATGDDLAIRFRFGTGVGTFAAAVTPLTLTAANLGSVGTTVMATIDDGDTTYRAWEPTSIQLLYNQTDAAPAITGGLVETILVIEAF